MFGSIKKKDYFHPFMIWVILLIWYLIFADNFFSTTQNKIDNFFAEQAFWFFNQTPKEAEKITIVAIDEASRRKLNIKWPWDRHVTARLIRDIASLSPEVIALDIVFSGKSEEEADEALISALESHPKVVQSFVLQRHAKQKSAKDLIPVSSSKGFVNKPMKGGTINQIMTFYAHDGEAPVFSLEMEALFNYLGLEREHIGVNKEGIYLKDVLIVPSTKGLLPLNYLVYPNKFRVIPAASVLEKKANPQDFKDKIVLVGVTDPLVHDEHLTPLGVWPGVSIIGNALVMLLSERLIYRASVGQNVLFAFLLGFLVILINQRFTFLRNTLFTFLFLVLVYFSLVYLRARDFQISYLFVFFSGTTAYMVPNLYRYSNLLYLSNRLKNLAITDPLTGFYAPRFFMLKLDEKLGSKEDLVFFALKIRNHKELTLSLSFEQIKSMTRQISDYLQSQIENHFKAPIFSRISNDTLAIIIEGKNGQEAETFFGAFVEKTRELEWVLDKEKIWISPQGCLIHKSKSRTGRGDDMIYQMEHVFWKTEGARLLVEEFEEVVGEDRKTRHQDILEFIAYDWEERNRDLENSLKEILEVNKRLDELNWGTLTALARAIDAKSKWTAGHSERVTQIALKIGKVLGLNREDLDNLHRAGLLHDIGKLGTPAEIIDNPDKLTDEEIQIIQEHPGLGERILEPIKAYEAIIPMVAQHHEWFNGRGYPAGLAGEAITLGARILAVADVYDALSSDRPYRAALDINQALEIIKENSGSRFDPLVVEALIKVMEPQLESKP